MFRRQSISFFTIVGILMLAGAVSAQVTDFSVVVSDSADPVEPDTLVSFVAALDNAGPGDSPHPMIFDITLPMGVPMPWTDYLALDPDGRAAANDAFFVEAQLATDPNIWDDLNSGIYMGDSFNNGCAGPIVQLQNLVLPGGTSGNVYYDASMPLTGGVAGVAIKPAGGDMVALSYGTGGCNSLLASDCGTGDPATGFPCMGTPLTVHDAVPAPIFDINEDGCEPEDFATFPSGSVAFINRGTCSFADKGLYATAAGASAIIVGNNLPLGSATPTQDSIMAMGCSEDWCHSLSMSPSAFISYNDATALRDALALGEVTGYVGVRDEAPEYRQTRGYIWENDPTGTAGTDSDLDNDRDVESTTLESGGIFADGFESGDTTAWTTVPPLPAKERAGFNAQLRLTPSTRGMTADW